MLKDPANEEAEYSHFLNLTTPRPYWRERAHVRETSKILAHKNARDKIADVARGLGAGDVVKVGRTVELEALDTPGHTMSHVCLLSHTDQPALFCGDTLFNAGAGNCHNGGHPAELYRTFSEQLPVPQSLDYPARLIENISFTFDREPATKCP